MKIYILEIYFFFQNGYSLFQKIVLVFKVLISLFRNSSNCSSGSFSFNTGFNNTIEQDYCFSSGLNNICSEKNSASIGENLVNNCINSLCVGTYNNKYTFDKLFSVGNGSEEERKDAFSVSSTGNVEVQNILKSKVLTDGKVQIENGEITNL